jgi:hypothetical protein
MIAGYGVFILILIVLQVIVLWRITAKAGYNGALSLLMFIPLVNLILVLIFAFGEWPIEAQLRALRGGGGSGMAPGTTVMTQ